jgi:hypothetical protein
MTQLSRITENEPGSAVFLLMEDQENRCFRATSMIDLNIKGGSL